MTSHHFSPSSWLVNAKEGGCNISRQLRLSFVSYIQEKLQICDEAGPTICLLTVSFNYCYSCEINVVEISE